MTIRVIASCLFNSSKLGVVLRLVNINYSSSMNNTKYIYITRKPPESVIKKLSLAELNVSFWNNEDPVPKDILLKECSGKAGILCTLSDKIDEDVIKTAGSSLKVISTLSVGYDHVSKSSLKKRNIKLGYTPDVLTDATAELAMALLLSTARRLPEAMACARDGRWGAWKPFWMCGPGLANSCVGIVGMGRIGRGIAERCVPFGVQRILYCRSPGSPIAKEATLLSNGFPMQQTTFEELVSQCDFIIASCAANDSNKHMFNDKVFSRMKRTSIFVNISRGSIVDQDALYEALASNKIGAAGLDVTTPEPLPLDNPLFKLTNCVILPHIGSASLQSRNDMWNLAADNLIAGVYGRKLSNEVTL